MNTVELRKILGNEGIKNIYYSLSESEPTPVEVVYCLREKENEYEVFISERNKHEEVQRFDNESDACKALLTMMSQYHDKRLAKYLR